MQGSTIIIGKIIRIAGMNIVDGCSESITLEV